LLSVGQGPLTGW